MNPPNTPPRSPPPESILCSGHILERIPFAPKPAKSPPSLCDADNESWLTLPESREYAVPILDESRFGNEQSNFVGEKKPWKLYPRMKRVKPPDQDDRPTKCFRPIQQPKEGDSSPSSPVVKPRVLRPRYTSDAR